MVKSDKTNPLKSKGYVHDDQYYKLTFFKTKMLNGQGLWTGLWQGTAPDLNHLSQRLSKGPVTVASLSSKTAWLGRLYTSQDECKNQHLIED